LVNRLAGCAHHFKAIVVGRAIINLIAFRTAERPAAVASYAARARIESAGIAVVIVLAGEAEGQVHGEANVDDVRQGNTALQTLPTVGALSVAGDGTDLALLAD